MKKDMILPSQSREYLEQILFGQSLQRNSHWEPSNEFSFHAWKTQRNASHVNCLHHILDGQPNGKPSLFWSMTCSPKTPTPKIPPQTSACFDQFLCICLRRSQGTRLKYRFEQYVELKWKTQTSWIDKICKVHVFNAFVSQLDSFGCFGSI